MATGTIRYETIDKQRATDKGPRYRTVGRTVEYTQGWLDDYLAGKEKDTVDSRRAG